MGAPQAIGLGRENVMDSTNTRTIKKAIKRHLCNWCGQWIIPGNPYKRWRHFDCFGAATVKMHPECELAMDELAQEHGSGIEFSAGENPRGCNCGHWRGCEKCAARKAELERIKAEARRERLPLPPGELVGVLHDTVHR